MEGEGLGPRFSWPDSSKVGMEIVILELIVLFPTWLRERTLGLTSV